MADTPEILYGTPDQRPSPLKLRGKIFIDYITPAAYLSLGDMGGWVKFGDTSGGGGGGGYTIISVATTPYTVVPITGTVIYLVDATAGNIVINFPTAVGNTATYGIKKIDASVNTVTLTPAGAETLDGAATQVIRFQNTEVDVFSNNANLLLK